MSDEDLEIQDSTIMTKKKRPRDDDLFLDQLNPDLYLPNLPQPQQAFLGNQNFSLAASDVSLYFGMPFVPATPFSPSLSGHVSLAPSDSDSLSQSDSEELPLLTAGSRAVITKDQKARPPKNKNQCQHRPFSGRNSLYGLFAEAFGINTIADKSNHRVRTKVIQELIFVTLLRLNIDRNKPLAGLILPKTISQSEDIRDLMDAMTTEGLQQLAHFIVKDDILAAINLHEPSNISKLRTNLDDIENRNYCDVSFDGPFTLKKIALINSGDKPAYAENTLYVEKDTWILHWYDPWKVSKQGDNFCSQKNHPKQANFEEFFSSQNAIIDIKKFQKLLGGVDRTGGRKYISFWNIIYRWRIHNNKTVENRPEKIPPALYKILEKWLQSIDKTPAVILASAAVPSSSSSSSAGQISLPARKKHSPLVSLEQLSTLPALPSFLQPLQPSTFTPVDAKSLDFAILPPPFTADLAMVASALQSSSNSLSLDLPSSSSSSAVLSSSLVTFDPKFDVHSELEQAIEKNRYRDLDYLLQPKFYQHFTEDKWRQILQVIGEKKWLGYFIFREPEPSAEFIIFLRKNSALNKLLVEVFLHHHQNQPKELERFVKFFGILEEFSYAITKLFMEKGYVDLLSKLYQEPPSSGASLVAGSHSATSFDTSQSLALPTVASQAVVSQPSHASSSSFWQPPRQAAPEVTGQQSTTEPRPSGSVAQALINAS